MNALDRETQFFSFATWSSINAINGLITRVVPPRAIPGNW
jgi:hypothetical protein